MSNRKIKAELEFSAKDSTSPAFRSVAARMGQIERQIGHFNKTAAGFSARVAQIQRAQDSVSRVSASVSKAYAAVQAGAGAFVAYGVGRAIKGAVTDFAAMERQMTRVGITAGVSAEETQAAFEVAQKAAKDLKFASVQPAIEAIDTMVASGKTLKEALAFLPSVLATAQATGSATSDIANTAIKAASALKIETGQMQRAFDLMVEGGKAGQFETKDMAQHIPALANSFATLGYDGEAGLKRLIVILQTIREDTATAEAAATQAGEIFGKIYAGETANNFKKFGVDIRKEMDAARKNGEDIISAFERISLKALKGDLSKLPLLFTDKEFRLGMQSLLTSAESAQKFSDILNSTSVDGTVFRDLQKVLSDTQSSIDDATASWEKLKTSFGKAVAENGGVQAMDYVTGSLDYATAVNRGLEQTGTASGFGGRSWWGLRHSQAEKDRMAIKGGYVDEALRQKYEQGPQVPKNWKPPEVEFPGGGTGATPLPGTRPERLTALPPLPAQLQAVPPALQSGPSIASMGQSPLRMPSKDEWQAALKIDATGITQSSDEAARKVADGGREAGKSIEEGAAFFRVAGYDVSTAIANAAQKLVDAAMSMNSLGRFAAPPGGGASGGAPPVNADTGRSMPPSTFGPR